VARPSRALPAIAVGLLTASLASAQAPGSPNTPPADAGAGPAKKSDAEKEKKLPWRGTTLNWAHRVSAQTLGVGADYQSSNPYYEWFFSFRPRYYIWQEGDNTLSIRGTANAVTELTNSDSTTDRGEFLFDDISLALTAAFMLAKDGDYRTVLTLTAPRFVLPTSKSSQATGMYTEVGARAGIEQGLPIRKDEALFPRGSVGLRTGYAYLFSRANVPEDTDLNRQRRDIDGVTRSNDQLGGAALARHRTGLHVIGSVDIWKDLLTLSTDMGIDVLWKSPLAEATIDTGTGATVPARSDAGRFQAIGYFNTELSAEPVDFLTIGLGYENVSPQLGPDGQRRTLFYSPESQFYLGVALTLDALYLRATGRRASSEEVALR
jgi:hypothetical protein